MYRFVSSCLQGHVYPRLLSFKISNWVLWPKGVTIIIFLFFFSKSTPKPLKKLTVDPSSLLLSEICNTPVGVIQDEYSSEWQRIFRFSHSRPNNQNFEPKFSLGLFRSILLWELSHFKSKRKLKLHLITLFSNSLTGNVLGWNEKGYIFLDASSRLVFVVHLSSSTH